MKKLIISIFCILVATSCSSWRSHKIINNPEWQGEEVTWEELDAMDYLSLGFVMGEDGCIITPRMDKMTQLEPICWSGYIYVQEGSRLYYSLTECKHGEEFDLKAFQKKSDKMTR